jgi:hypothetical protein
MVNILVGSVGSPWKEILLELVREDDQLKIIYEAYSPIEILLQTRNTSADVVVLSYDLDDEGKPAEPGVCSHLLLQYPNLVIVLVPPSKEVGELCRMVQLKEKREANKDTLHAMLREQIRDGWPPS